MTESITTCINGHPITNKPVLMPDGIEVPSNDCDSWCNSRSQMRNIYPGACWINAEHDMPDADINCSQVYGHTTPHNQNHQRDR